LPQFLPLQSSEEDERYAEEGRQSTQEATLAQSFRVLAELPARNEEGAQADAAVAEAPENSVLPLRHFLL